MLLCVFWFLQKFPNRSSYALDYTLCNKTLAIFGLGIIFCIKQFFILNPVNFNLSVCLRIKKYGIKQENICGQLGSIQRPQSHQAYTLTTVLPLWLYLITYASVTLHNVIYVFNVNSHNIHGYCRSWIKYLNERFNVCILSRSKTLDNSLSFIQLFQAQTTRQLVKNLISNY